MKNLRRACITALAALSICIMLPAGNASAAETLKRAAGDTRDCFKSKDHPSMVICEARWLLLFGTSEPRTPTNTEIFFDTYVECAYSAKISTVSGDRVREGANWACIPDKIR